MVVWVVGRVRVLLKMLVVGGGNRLTRVLMTLVDICDCRVAFATEN